MPSSSPFLPWQRRMWLLWLGSVAGAALLVGLAVLPPWLPPSARWLLMEAFAPLCHQLPARSPTIDGTHIAVCDRCIGIYAGLLGGVVLAAALRAIAQPVRGRWLDTSSLTWDQLLSALKYGLAGALIPLALDWIGPFIGAWTPMHGWQNSPVSRVGTGAFLGVVAGLFLVVTIASSVSRGRKSTASPGSEQAVHSNGSASV